MKITKTKTALNAQDFSILKLLIHYIVERVFFLLARELYHFVFHVRRQQIRQANMNFAH